jgi:hypothetical protein
VIVLTLISLQATSLKMMLVARLSAISRDAIYKLDRAGGIWIFQRSNDALDISV